MAAVRLKLPPFWTKNAKVWFAQVEAQFQLQHITSQITKYLHVVSALPAEVADELEDILAATPTANQYDHLKAAILARKTASERSRLQSLLNMEEVGDQRPSQLLRRMRQLLGDCTSEADTSLLRELFLQRLPSNMVVVLAAAEDMPLERMAELADRVAEYSTTPVVAATGSHPHTSEHAAATPAQDIATRLSRLKKAIQDLRLSGPRRASSRRRSSHRRASPAPGSSDSGVCWYHRTFGAAARKCFQPCSWQEISTTGH
ncbi:unnamed protein product [Ixodes hexagonus]